jgi:phosphohistidine phosphatase
MLKRLHKVAAKVRHTMLVGHNPGLHELAQLLAGTGAEADLAALAEKLPTAGLVVLELDVGSWAKVKAAGPKGGGGRLKLFAAPKLLPDAVRA